MVKSRSERLNLERLVGTGMALLEDGRAVGGRGSAPTQTAEPVPTQGIGSSRFGLWKQRLARVTAGVLPGFWLLILGWVIAIYFITYFLLPRLPLSASGNIYVVQPALWMSLGLVGLLLWRWGLQDKPRISAYIVALGLLAGVFHIALLILAGMIAGFGHSPYGDSPEVVAQNLLYVGSGVLGLELARAYLLAVFARRSSLAALAFVSLLLALVTIPKARFMDLGSGEGGFETLGDTFLPGLSESLLASFLALVGGPLASIAYRGALEAFRWFSPILPDLSWSATAFVGTLAPALALLILRGLMVPGTAKDAGKEGHRESWVLFPSGVAITAVSLLWLGTGLLGVRPALVAGHSMEPALRTGDVVLTREVSDDDVAVGDIVRFTKGNTTVVHRVNEVYASGGTTWIVTKGDANNVNDDPITADQVDGEVLLTIPKIGWVGIFVKNAAVSGLGGGGPGLWVWMIVGSAILATVGLLMTRGISPRSLAKRRQDPWMAAASLQHHLGGTAQAGERPPVSPVPTPVKDAVPPPPKATPRPQPAARRRAPSPRAPILLAVVESVGSAIGVALAVIALWAADRGLARAIARQLGRRSHQARRVSANRRRVTTPAPPATNAPVSPEPPLRRRPRRALALASLAAAQAIGVAVAVGALWAAGTVSFSGDGATCPSEPTTLATEPGPRTTAALDAPGLDPMAPAVAAASEIDGASRAAANTAAPEVDGSPPAPAVAAATREPTAVATALPPITEEQPPVTPETAQYPAAPLPAEPTLEYEVQPGDTLFDIALRFGTTVEVLVQLNGLTTAQVVWVGQVLQVPGIAPPPSPALPTAPVATPAPPDIPAVGYTVRPGERLSDVAAFFGTTVDAIVALNGLTDPNLVVAGQRLVVPAPPANTAPGRAFMSEYVVQPGETLIDIAARFGTTVDALAAENGLANPSAIRIGDRLRVP